MGLRVSLADIFRLTSYEVSLKLNAPTLVDLPGIETDLERLEARLREVSRVGDPRLDEITTHLVQAGGKRIRPVLTLSLATTLEPAGSPATEDMIQGGICVELVHLASLYHDDVMDEATTRRNVESVNARWGNLMAIVAGDFLLARSAELAAELGSDIAGLLAATLGKLCHGQMGEVQRAYDPSRSEEHYLEVISNKTAALMSTACRIGALTARAPKETVEAVTLFGQRFGMAFQLRDDLMDVVGSEEQLGKPPGQDLAEGIYTLPVLLALKDERAALELEPLLGHPLSQAERDKARAVVSSTKAVTEVACRVRQLANEATEALAGVQPPSLVKALESMASWVTEAIPHT